MSADRPDYTSAPPAFIKGGVSFVNSWDIANDFGMEHDALLQNIEVARSLVETKNLEWFCNREREIAGSTIDTVDVSYSGFGMLDLPDPHGANLKRSVAYISALSSADKLAHSPGGGVH